MNDALLVLGLVVLVLGVLAAGYTIYQDQVYFFGAYKETNAIRPYVNITIPLIAAGLIIMLLSALVPSVKTTTKKSYIENPVKKTKIIEEEG